MTRVILLTTGKAAPPTAVVVQNLSEGSSANTDTSREIVKHATLSNISHLEMHDGISCQLRWAKEALEGSKAASEQQKERWEKELYDGKKKFENVRLDMWALKRSLSESHRDAQEAYIEKDELEERLEEMQDKYAERRQSATSLQVR